MEEILASIRRILAEDQALFAGEKASRLDFAATENSVSGAVETDEVSLDERRLDVEAAVFDCPKTTGRAAKRRAKTRPAPMDALAHTDRSFRQ